MRGKLYCFSNLLLLCYVLWSCAAPDVLTSFYTAMAGDDTLKINSALKAIQTVELAEKTAFEGTLYMKKAGYVKPVGAKLDMFKKGNAMLEHEIKKQTDNAEYRFCRLMIQENAPRILGYRNQINEDAAIIKRAYPQFNAELKAFVKSYSKKSKALKNASF